MRFLCLLVVVLVCLQRASLAVKRVKCGKLEQYVACPNTCARDDCSKLVDKHPCDPVQIPCKGRCMCKDGYFRNYLGNCVPGALCFKSCDANEEWDDCPDSCDDKLCPVDGIEVQCRPGPPGECIGRCVCSQDFYRDSDEKCVSKDVCVKCQRNEIWNPSPTKYNDQPCSATNSTCVVHIGGGREGGKCVCEEGYYRNLNGECASKEDCDKCTNNHEVFACGSACDTTCATLTKPCPIINIVCNPKCYCQNGYARDKNNVCILATKCNTKNSCKANEEFLTNGTACEVTCANRNRHVLCINKLVAGCFCQNGLIRDESGDCILREKCPENNCDASAHEVFAACKRICPPQVCGVRPELIRCARPPCIPGCDCEEGFLRAKSGGSCIPKSKCPATQECGENEYLQECPVGCPTDNCQTEITPIPQCLPPFPCQPAKCKCIASYKRNRDGVCVPANKCPCNKNETFSECGYENTCLNIDEETEWDGQCHRGCFCNEEFVRDEDGVCILEKDCTYF